MTRSWVFTLAVPNQWYNLWNDLIIQDVSFTDPTFTNGAFVPDRVCELQTQSPSPANAGMILSIAYDGNKEGGTDLTSGSADLRRTNRNAIGLKQTWYKADIGGALVNVAITAN